MQSDSSTIPTYSLVTVVVMNDDRKKLIYIRQILSEVLEFDLWPQRSHYMFYATSRSFGKRSVSNVFDILRFSSHLAVVKTSVTPEKIVKTLKWPHKNRS